MEDKTESGGGWIPFLSRGECTKLMLKDICYIEHEGNETVIRTKARTYFTRDKMQVLEPYMTDSLFHCTKLKIINFENVTSVIENRVVFDNGYCLFLGRDSFYRTRKAFYEYLVKRNPCHESEKRVIGAKPE